MSARSGGGPSYAPPASGGGSGVTSVNGKVGPAVTLVASDVGAQPVDSDLTAIAALATTAYGRNFLVLANIAALQAVMGPTGVPRPPHTFVVMVRGQPLRGRDCKLPTTCRTLPTLLLLC